jgi:hypothetical protein
MYYTPIYMLKNTVYVISVHIVPDMVTCRWYFRVWTITEGKLCSMVAATCPHEALQSLRYVAVSLPLSIFFQVPVSYLHG